MYELGRLAQNVFFEVCEPIEGTTRTVGGGLGHRNRGFSCRSFFSVFHPIEELRNLSFSISARRSRKVSFSRNRSHATSAANRRGQRDASSVIGATYPLTLHRAEVCHDLGLTLRDRSAGDNRRIGYARRGVKATFFRESPIWVKMRAGSGIEGNAIRRRLNLHGRLL